MNRHLLNRRWVHSHEEDTEGEMVFRPATHDFPPSRGRRFFECHVDGTVALGGPGPTDAPLEQAARWQLDGSRLVIYAESPSSPTRVMEIVAADDQRLIVRK